MLDRGVSRDVGLGLRMVVVLAVLLAVYVGVIVLALLLARHWPVFLALVLVIPAIDLWAGGHSLAELAGARTPEEDERALLRPIVERVAAMADVVPPELAIVDTPVPNAFALGRRRRSSLVVVTTGLAEALDDRELEAVLAHEITHIANHDTAVMTLASPLAVVGGRLFYTPIWPLAAAVFFIGTLITITLSRYREYVADHGAAVLTGQPEHLMSALVKISGEMSVATTDLRQAEALRAFLIVPPQGGRHIEVFMDHPPLEKRLARLDELARELGKVG
jgi:heat shock protein HtpX